MLRCCAGQPAVRLGEWLNLSMLRYLLLGVALHEDPVGLAGGVAVDMSATRWETAENGACGKSTQGLRQWFISSVREEDCRMLSIVVRSMDVAFPAASSKWRNWMFVCEIANYTARKALREFRRP